MDKSLAKHKYNGYRLKVLPGLINSEFLDICCREKFPESGDFQPVPASDYARVFRFNYKNQWYFHKTFCPRNIMEPVKNFIRGSRADRSLKGHSILADNGFLAPPIVIVGNKKQHNFIVTISVPMHISFGDFLQNRPGWNADIFFKHKKHQIEQLGNLVGRLHAANITHGDLICGNLLLSGNTPEQYKIYFIDNESIKRYPVLTAKIRVKNLAQLNRIGSFVTKTDRMRFFKHYRRQSPKFNDAGKTWIKKILGRTARKVAKRARKNTPT